MNHKRRSLGAYAWISSVVGYSIARAVAVWGLLGDTVNPWVFAAIDIGTAVPYAFSTAALPQAIADSKLRSIVGHGLVATTTFFAPYVYVWYHAAQSQSSGTVLRGIAVFAAVMVVVAIMGLRRRTKQLSNLHKSTD